MDRRVSCPRCDFSVAMAESLCPRCGFALMEQRLPGRYLLGVLARVSRSRYAARTGLLAVVALVTAVGVVPAVGALSAAFAPASKSLSSGQVEQRLFDRYPKLRHADDAVIACPDRRIGPGGQARCWVLARVGQQRAVMVRLSPRGDELRIDD